jgi:hypothetical protein
VKGSHCVDAALMGLFQRFEQEEYFGGHSDVQFRVVGEIAVTAAGDDGLEGLDEGVNPGGQLWKRRVPGAGTQP